VSPTPSSRHGGAGGPAVVAIGGGHGQAATLRAARRYAGSITAIVSVADDGGSSGRLRAAMPQLPAPGDVRRCLSALADPESALGSSLEHRYGEGDGSLAGHALGNLLLAGLTAATGSFPAAVDEVGRLVSAVGRVLPATVGPVWLEGDLHAEPEDAGGGPHPSSGAFVPTPRVIGQVEVQNSRGMRRLTIQPADAESPPDVAEAILAADQVVLGPGSLFTSVLAVAIVPAVRRALEQTRANRVYVANLAPQVPETEGFTAADHIEALLGHGVPVDVALFHPGALGCEAGIPVPLVERPVADDRGLAHHPERLADALAWLADRR
jgi:uncharacterized cofD-like protein